MPRFSSWVAWRLFCLAPPIGRLLIRDMQFRKVCRKSSDIHLYCVCQFLTKLMTEFNHNIPNSAMSDMKVAADAVLFFSTAVSESTTLEDLSARRVLPPNLHIQTDYLRFNPDTDTMFSGKTAFPGRDTYVTSIKYRRKYKDIKNTKEKPGYVNYYFGY